MGQQNYAYEFQGKYMLKKKFTYVSAVAFIKKNFKFVLILITLLLAFACLLLKQIAKQSLSMPTL